MSRRGLFIIAIALGILLAPLAAAAQPAGKVYRIGCLHLGPREPSAHLLKALEEGLRELGYVQGQNLVIEYRFADGKAERLADLAAELVRLKPDVIIASLNPVIAAVKRATATIPVVFPSAGRPVEEGLIASLAQPGGNVTGLTLNVGPELGAKRLQLLKEFVPGVSRVAVLWNPSFRDVQWDVFFGHLKDAAKNLRMAIQFVEVRGAGDFESAFAAILRERAGGLFVFAEPLTFAHRRQIAEFAVKNGLASSYNAREFVEAGGFMSYGANLPDLYRRAASYVDKILKGSKPGDLPVEQPTRFELIINLKTAKALGLTIPQSVLIRADEVIQ